MSQKILASESEQGAVWDVRPFQIVSLLEMIEFKARDFIKLAQYIKWVQVMIENTMRSAPDAEPVINEESKNILTTRLETILEACNTIGLELSVMLVDEIKKAVEKSVDKPQRDNFAAASERLQNVKDA
jgi:hypothetical protein